MPPFALRWLLLLGIVLLAAAERPSPAQLFEGLLRPAADSSAGRFYEPALARELPRLVTRGREFTLAAGAAWADPDHPNAAAPVTAADVKITVDKLKARAGQSGAEVA